MPWRYSSILLPCGAPERKGRQLGSQDMTVLHRIIMITRRRACDIVEKG